MTNEPEIIVAELKLPVSVDTLAAIADALGAVHGKNVLLMRQEGPMIRIFKPGAKEEARDNPTSNATNYQLRSMRNELSRAQYQLAACRAAAKGEPLPPEVLPASQALDEVLALRRCYEHLEKLVRTGEKLENPRPPLDNGPTGCSVEAVKP